MMRAVATALALVLASCSAGSGGKPMSHYSIDAFQTASARDFIQAVMAGDVARARALGALAPDGFNTFGKDGESAILIAVDRGDVAMVQALLAAGANPNGGPNRTPLHPATREIALKMLPMLLAAKADPNLPFADQSPLFEAALIGEVRAAKMLLASGAKIELGNNIGITPSIKAATADHWDMVLFLIDNGASIWQAAPNGFTIATFAEDSRVRRDIPNGKALETVIQRHRDAGYPWPPPGPPEVKKLIDQGQWPPKRH